MQRYIKVIIAAIMWSISSVLLKQVNVNGFEALFISCTIGFFIVFTKVVIEKRIAELKPQNLVVLLLLIAIGVFHVLNNGTYLSAIKITTLSNAALSHYLYPVLIPLFAFIVKEKVEKVSMFASLISFVGLLTILFQNDLRLNGIHFWGLLLGCTSALFAALQILFGRLLVDYYQSDIVVIWELFLTCGILSPFVSWNKYFALPTLSLLALGTSGILTGISYIIFFDGLKLLKTQYVSVLTYIEPLAVILWGILLFNETPRIMTVVGGGLIVLGGIIVIRYGNEEG